MTDEEALAKADGAIKAAHKAVGDNRRLIREELERRKAADPSLFEAFKQIGQRMQQAQQGH
ncbi:hypothetical protein [Caballeronia sp. NCTM5]|uniref:hypothetical protein n=1 Tax=Caballeronia sp. NCTM5 TaxID=2921755 RepID=UPI00202968C4|nr:hypothetical protein [Caballeronia sp. NCTM5]